MKKLFILATVTSLVLFATYSAQACGIKCGPASEEVGSAEAGKISKTGETKMAKFANVYAVDEKGNEYAVCPVTGSPFEVSPDNSFSEVDGKIYYHCCAGCEKPFQADPEKYMKKMKKNMTEAKKMFEKGERPSRPQM